MMTEWKEYTGNEEQIAEKKKLSLRRKDEDK